MIGDGNDERKQEALTFQCRRWAQCVKIITHTKTVIPARRIILVDIGMTRKCASMTSAATTAQGKVAVAPLRTMICPSEQRRKP